MTWFFTWLILGLVVLFAGPSLVGGMAARLGAGATVFLTRTIRFASLLFFAAAIVSTSILIVPPGEIAQFKRVILGSQLKDGKIIALDGEMGPQAWIKREGFHFMPFVSFLYQVDKIPLQQTPDGRSTRLIAFDGEPLGPNEAFAPDWEETVKQHAGRKLAGELSGDEKEYYQRSAAMSRQEIERSMLDAGFFLRNGGKKGPQSNVLKPGTYAINSYLFEGTLANVVRIDAGHVGVVTSRTGKTFQSIERKAPEDVAVPLVPRGHVGVWRETLTPGNYYINRKALTVQPFDTRVQTWVYTGGYNPREVDVSISPDGKIIQREIKGKRKEMDENAADEAIDVKTKDGWVLHVEVRLQVQVEPEYAASIVAGVGSLAEVEDRIITPNLRSVLRNVGERTVALDFLSKRSEIEGDVERVMTAESARAGVTVKEVKIGHVDIDPALLIPKKREQLAEAMKAAYGQEQAAYEKQIESNRSKATAEQQPQLVQAQIEYERARLQKKTRETLGEGEKLYLAQVAEGQQAQSQVLGEDKTYNLQIVKMFVDVCRERPEVCSQVPVIYSAGGDSGQLLESFGALGLQNIIKAGEAISRRQSTAPGQTPRQR